MFRSTIRHSPIPINFFSRKSRHRRTPVETSRQIPQTKLQTMKKHLLFLFAAILAIGLSSYTTLSHPKLQTLYYQNGATWGHLEANPCTSGIKKCKVDIGSGDFRQVFFAEDTNQPVPGHDD